MITIFSILLGVILIIWGLVCFWRTVFRWDSYSQNFPLENIPKWKINMTKYLYITYGDKAVRKYILVMSLAFVVLGICFPVMVVKDTVERGQINGFPQVWQGETTPFAGGELTLDEVCISESFTAKRFNVDENRYEEVEVKADSYNEDMLLIKATFTNNSGSTLTLRQEDMKFYAKPEEGNNINGRSVVDGYLYQTDDIELAIGESVPIFFWMSLSKEEQQLYVSLVLQYGKTGCQVTSQKTSLLQR